MRPGFSRAQPLDPLVDPSSIQYSILLWSGAFSSSLIDICNELDAICCRAEKKFGKFFGPVFPPCKELSMQAIHRLNAPVIQVVRVLEKG